MTRTEIEEIGRAVLGHSPSRWEADHIDRATRTLGVKSGDAIVVLLIVQYHLLAQQKMFTGAFEGIGDATAFFAKHKARFTKWGLTAAAILGMLFWGIYDRAYRSGRSDEVARHVELVRVEDPPWLKTPDGIAARALYEAGLAQQVAECKIPTWIRQGGDCITSTSNGKPNSFRLP